ncbi:hypothetical protein [Streptomyces sp. SudanB66_2053]
MPAARREERPLEYGKTVMQAQVRCGEVGRYASPANSLAESVIPTAP